MEKKEFGKEWQDEQREKMVRIQFPKTVKRIEDKAREEGYKAMLEGLDNIARDSSGGFYKGVAIIKLRNEIARLSKLKDNK